MKIIKKLLKLALWGLGLLLGGLMVVFVGIQSRISHHEQEVDQAWKQTIGSTPEEFYQSLISRHPKSERNEAARQLEKRCGQLGIANTNENNPALPAFKSYLDAQISKSSDDIEETPETIHQYLMDHADDLSALYTEVRRGEVPRWETDISRLAEAPMPPLALHHKLQRVIAVDILEKTRRGENEKALEALEASWKINQSFQERPEMTTRLVATQILNRQAGVLRKMRGVPAEWQSRITQLYWPQDFFQAFACDALVAAEYILRHNGPAKVFGSIDRIIFSPIGKPLRRVWRVQLLEAASRAVAEMQQGHFASFDPDIAYLRFARTLSRWNIAAIVLPNYAPLWKIATRSTLNRELTREVLYLKQARQAGENADETESVGGTVSRLGPETKWVHRISPEGDILITGTQWPDWLQREEQNELPLTYSLKAKS